MKIAFFTDSYHPDLNGVVISIDEYARTLREKGHTVYIVAPKVPKFKDKDSNVIRLPSFTILHSDPDVMFPLPIPIDKLIATLKLDIDIIHAHG
ncbi:MAG: glycosyltransferase, partial [Patescibacteria group bacterium]|nr:glycosyltransferase [Patescibacteria group bacterium]